MSPMVFFDKWIQRLRGSVGPLGVTEANSIEQRTMQGLRGGKPMEAGGVSCWPSACCKWLFPTGHLAVS